MIKHILIFGFTLGCSAAWANYDISCRQNDCLHFGWVVTELKSGAQLAVECKNGDCDKNGWSSIYRARQTEDVVCKSGGCFNEGWRSYNSPNNQLQSEVSCLNSFAAANCLSVGWTTTVPGRGTTTFRCTNGDCRNVGWDVGSSAVPAARCKAGGCFTVGWAAYQ